MAYSHLYLKSRTPRERGALAALPEGTGEVATPHKAFNRAANHPERGYIGTGNVVSSVQRSTFVRAFSKTRCNGFDFQPGELRASDMTMFRATMPSNMVRRVEDLSADRDLIVYEFRSPVDGGRHKTHGWLITDEHCRHIETACLPHDKSVHILHEMAKRLSWTDRDAVDPVPTEEILKAARGIDLAELRALAGAIGMVVTHDWESCRERDIYHSPEDPVSVFRPGAEQERVRSDDPAVTATMMCIREGISPEQLREMRAEVAVRVEGEAEVEEDAPEPGL